MGITPLPFMGCSGCFEFAFSNLVGKTNVPRLSCRAFHVQFAIACERVTSVLRRDPVDGVTTLSKLGSAMDPMGRVPS